MGQKVNPIGFRVGINRTWNSRWYADGDEYAVLLHEDLKIQQFLETKLANAAKYYEEQVVGLGSDFLDEALVALKKIRDFPEAWAPVSKSQRRCRLNRFPYGLIYEIRPEEIIIASDRSCRRTVFPVYRQLSR